MSAGAKTARRRAPVTATAAARGGHTGLAAIPTVYRDVWMRSRLEARWAAVLDRAGLEWDYEPQVIHLGKGRGSGYLPDFWLPGQQTWLEVKGPHWERFEKTRRLAHRLGAKGQVLVATAVGVCWRVPYQGLPSQEEVWLGRCVCGVQALGVPARGTLGCRNPGCGGRAPAGEVLGW